MWLAEHGEVIEADLQREYRIDLLDWWRGRLTARRLTTLVFGLSPDALLWKVLEQTETAATPEPGKAPTDLRNIPVAKSMRDVSAFVRGDDLPQAPGGTDV